MGSHPLLEKIADPSDLRRLDRRHLGQLATELRAFIVDSVAATGGHLSSNLGTVELTIALHYVFHTPVDRLIWDVGHQTYGHKILTGRREGMKRLRQKGGIAGFPRREESEYDTFGTAHSSTSISAALGMAVAATGGHLSSNLGTVELAIARHYVFQTPEDRLIWDVGHQTYGHNILTGRREGMTRLRQKG